MCPMKNTTSKTIYKIIFIYVSGYFQELRHLMDDKTPPLYGVSNNPPTPLCSSLFDLIQRPLQLTTIISAPEFR